MNVCIVIDGISNSGGTDRVVSLISSNFVENSIPTTVYSLNPGEPYYNIDAKVSIKYARKNSRLMKLVSCCSFLKNNNFDNVIIISMGRLSAQIIPLLKVFGVRSKLICNDHVSFNSFNKIIKLIKKPALILADEVVVLTEYDQSFLQKEIGIKSTVIRNISPYEDIKIKNENEKNIALAIGRLTYQKNFDRLLSLWNSAETTGWSLKIVGDGEDRDKLNKLIVNLGIKNITLEYPTKNIEEWYKKASIILMTSRYEGLPMVLIEAKNFGLPTMAFDCETGPREIITNDGYVIDYENDYDYINKLNLLLSSKESRAEMSNNALINSSQFTSTKVIKDWLKILKK